MMESGDIKQVFKSWNSMKQDVIRPKFWRETWIWLSLVDYNDKDALHAIADASSQERTNVATFDWMALYIAL